VPNIENRCNQPKFAHLSNKAHFASFSALFVGIKNVSDHFPLAVRLLFPDDVLATTRSGFSRLVGNAQVKRSYFVGQVGRLGHFNFCRPPAKAQAWIGYKLRPHRSNLIFSLPPARKVMPSAIRPNSTILTMRVAKPRSAFITFTSAKRTRLH
jgi:hypothetical protein